MFSGLTTTPRKATPLRVCESYRKQRNKPLRFAIGRIAQRHFSFGHGADRIGRMFATPEFWSALAAIVVIDLVLAGDNAIVIALGARNPPKAGARRAIIWGTVGAVVVRASLTVAVL